MQRDELQATSGAVQAELDLILSSAEFRRSKRLSHFLRFVVEMALQGRDVKERTIGLQVYHRGTSFDSRVDGIVRVEANRLRKKLSEYYFARGLADGVRIELPAGSYSPAFINVTSPADPHLDPTPTPGIDPAPVPPPHRPNRKALIAGALLAVMTLVFLWREIRRPVEPQAIAVLPFLNLTGKANEGYVSDLLTEEITNELSRVSGLNVVARTSAWSFRGNAADAHLIGQKLNVNSLLEGGLEQRGNALRLVLRLVDTHNGYVLWSGAFESRPEDVPDLRTLVVQQVAAALKRSYTRTVPAHREDPRARDLWAQGRYLDRLGGPIDKMKEAIRLYEQAVMIDPGFAMAFASIADTYARLGANVQMDPLVALPRAREAAMKALHLDPSLADAHSALGLVDWSEWNLSGDEQEQRAALALNPNYALALHRIAMIHLAQARFAEAENELKRSRALNPMAYQEVEALGQVYFYWRRFDKAWDQCNLVIQSGLESDFLPLLAGVDEETGRYQEALERWRQIANHYPDWPNSRSVEARILARAGRTDQALALVNDVIARRSSAHYDSAFEIASVWAALKDKDTAFRWLETAFREHDASLVSLKVDHWTDPLHTDRRYREMLRRVGLE
jgi:TolB-like protein